MLNSVRTVGAGYRHRLFLGNTFLVRIQASSVFRKSRLLVAAGFLIFSLFYVTEASFPGPHYRSYVLLGCLAGAILASIILRLELDETLVMGLVFAVPMVDQLIYSRSLEARMVEEIILCIAIPLGLLWLVRRDLRPWDVGLSLGYRRSTLKVTLILLTIAAVVSVIGLGFPSMVKYYPIWRTGPSVSTYDYVYNEAVISIIMLGCEFFFRGLVLFTLARRSFWGAIIFQSLPYTFLHFGKPSIEVPYSLVAGITFGWANLRSRSILPSWLTHSLGSALFDALVLLT